MEFKRLVLRKRFPRWNEEDYSRAEYTLDRWAFEKEYDHHQGSLKPDKNPFSKIVYNTRQGPFDIYDVGLRRGLIISNRLLKLLKDFNLSEHVVFPKVKYRYKEEFRDDMNFIYFYNNYDRYVDYSKSVYWVLKKGYYRDRNSDWSIKHNYIHEDNLRFGSYEDFTKASEIYGEKNLDLTMKYTYCSNINNLDLFSMKGRLETGLIISTKLQKVLLDKKMKGLKFSNLDFSFID